MVKVLLKKQVPAYVQETPEWGVFLRWVSQKKIRTRDQLKKTIKDEIKKCQETMNKNMASMRNGTNTRIVRQCAKKLDFLKLARDRIVKYV